ncbi:DsrE/DsrF/DrsH-like family protein [Halothermothrix orenii]|uniref:Uncharacterized conserved protein n=1 Tax=Halothermothrix orenii (strain H 168 / OCM 544 / DSM 9562) TaxID=373903 RepID=B8CZN0_HALOH|nr:DsrE/DsrF/DrsH-like family protein [Halothermothrix orenii]ACL70749.1 uncharacterized conserved protein [Halothermothrix orenii H 168]
MTKKLNILMFSCEYDKALAAFILADSARAIDMEVSMFFAFWGLFLLRTPDKLDYKDKTNLEKMFGAVTPKGPDELPLSRMNFSGFGKFMLKKMMKDDDAPTLKGLLEEAHKKGVNFYCCKLSSEVMGIKKDELPYKTKIMTAEDYLNDALNSDIQLFI